MTARRRTRIRTLVIVLLMAAALGGARVGVAQTGEFVVFLPLGWHGVASDALPTAAIVTPASPTPTATSPPPSMSPPPATSTLRIPPTITPVPTSTPLPTEPPVPSLIHGRITVEGDPLHPGYGTAGLPQIELRRCDGFAETACVGDEWQVARRTVSLDGGRFEFKSPPPLGEGDAYQVWWRNDIDGEFQGSDLFLHRWWSRPIESFGWGDTVDVGVFEVADLKLREICHDCGQSLPIVFKWDTRRNRREEYSWSLFHGCGEVDNRYTAYRTALLGHEGEYELTAPPRSFRLNEKYCWYVFIDDGENGTGWPFHDWRVTFLPTP